MYQKATRKQSKLRMTIDGPAGAGKTYTALRFAFALAQGGRVAMLDTEHGSASKYAGEAPDGYPWEFDTENLTTFSPEKYTEAILAASKASYSVLVIDSLSHAWEGKGGALEMKDRSGDKNSYTAWRNVTPIHNRMVDTILQAPLHIITTMRSRMEYVQDLDESGKKVVGIRKVGLAPIQRPGMEYEFDIVCDMNWDHILTVSKSRCSAIVDLKTEKPGPAFLQPVIEWLNSGSPSVRKLEPDELMAQYGVDKVLAANGGNIPNTPEEWATVAASLGK